MIDALVNGIISTAKLIYENKKRMEANVNECDSLFERINTIVNALQPLSQNQQQEKLIPGLQSLQRCLTECNIFIEELAKNKKWEQFFYANKHNEKIKNFNDELTRCIGLLNLSIDIRKFSEPTIDLHQTEILAQQQVQTKLLQRMEAKLIDPRYSQEIRALKQEQMIQHDFMSRMEVAMQVISQHQNQQANQTEQTRQNDLLQIIHRDLTQSLQKAVVNSKDITMIKHEQMLVINMLQELQQDFHTYRQEQSKKTALSCYNNIASYDADVLFEKAMLYKKQNDWVSSYEHCLKAAELGHPLAKAHVGSCLLQGKGTKPNPEVAFIWLSQAAEHEEPRAMYNLARMYETGVGVKEDKQFAKTWYERAAQQTTSPEVAVHAREKCAELSNILVNNI